mmetsp:Transcript_62060/g.128460  ORF Transcript_62060/g.128460 Transcript_62060/m.128460 type:complete len:204 (-) Transcript_62060:1759-2370(-)
MKHCSLSNRRISGFTASTTTAPLTSSVPTPSAPTLTLTPPLRLTYSACPCPPNPLQTPSKFTPHTRTQMTSPVHRSKMIPCLTMKIQTARISSSAQRQLAGAPTFPPPSTIAEAPPLPIPLLFIAGAPRFPPSRGRTPHLPLAGARVLTMHPPRGDCALRSAHDSRPHLSTVNQLPNGGTVNTTPLTAHRTLNWQNTSSVSTS